MSKKRKILLLGLSPLLVTLLGLLLILFLTFIVFPDIFEGMTNPIREYRLVHEEDWTRASFIRPRTNSCSARADFSLNVAREKFLNFTPETIIKFDCTSTNKNLTCESKQNSYIKIKHDNTRVLSIFIDAQGQCNLKDITGQICDETTRNFEFTIQEMFDNDPKCVVDVIGSKMTEMKRVLGTNTRGEFDYTFSNIEISQLR